MTLRKIILPLGLGIGTLSVVSVAGAQSPLKDKRVGVYVSKKNFRFGYEFNQTFAGMLQMGDSLGLTEEALQTGMTIWLGNYTTHTLAERLGCRDAFFVNARPELARTLVSALENPDFQIHSVKPLLPAGTDYLLLIDAVRFRKESKRTYLTYSNQLYTLPRKTTVATARLRLYGVKTGTLAAKIETTIDSDTPPAPRRLIPEEADHNPGLTIWNRLLDDALHKLTGNLKNE
jgi:hypothetical protein